MQLTNYMSRKDVRHYLRQQAKEFNKIIRDAARRKQTDFSKKLIIDKYYVVRSKALLYYGSKDGKPTVIYDHNVEKRKVGS